MIEPQGTPAPSRRGEFELIDWIGSQVRPGPRVPVGIGDDCALVRCGGGGEVLVTTDMLMEGRHFRLDQASAADVGYKALAVNLSDIAAMAGRPSAAFLAVALPIGRAESLAHELIAGMVPLADRFDVVLAGGDTNAWDGPLVISVTLLGEVVPPGPVLRRGAEPGDLVWVTGPLGGSLLGRHLRPEPRVHEAQALHRAVRLKAMIDLSDGLSSDLPHILKASGGVGAVIEETRLPIHPDAERLAGQDGQSALEHALNDGEDFELCFVTAPEDGERLDDLSRLGVSVFPIGRVVSGAGLRLVGADGQERRIEPGGFDHLKRVPR